MFCRACGREVADDAGSICPECGQNPGTPEMNEGSLGIAPQEHRDGPAFEHWQRDGFVTAVIDTCKGMLLEPEATCRQMKTTGLGSALGFAAIMAALGGFLAGLWGLVLNVGMLGLSSFSGNSRAVQGAALNTGMGVIGIPIQMVAATLFAVVFLFIWGGVMHLVLMMFKADKNGYEATVRVYAYATAGSILQVVPFLGGMVGGIWGMVVLIIGLREIHETTIGPALGAVLLPMVVCCVCGMGFFFTVMFGAVGIAGAGG